MDTVITEKNPFGYNRYGFAWEHIPQSGRDHLDFGCYEGSFLGKLKSKNLSSIAGVDVSQKAITKAKQNLSHYDIRLINQSEPLPFENGQFSSITLLDVLEHVYDQKQLLDELNRVLENDGILIVTVPGKHLFSLLDTGNFKFLFPKLHKWYVCHKYSQEEYNSRYVSNKEGLIGDISTKKRWHEHFSQSYLVKMVNSSGFKVEIVDGSGFFSRPLNIIENLFKWCSPFHRLINYLSVQDSKLFKSTNLFAVFRKII